ncbi:unnamed protein product [Symbiodinium sp. CCMP2592]|nr:unnamed protein product [Symbiodinium sp. CCMP2592]
MVDEADIFISHTWTADSWLKHAAICLHLNFKLALGSAISAWMSVIGYIAMTGLTSWGGCHILVVAGVYVPTLLFFLVVFYGHRLGSLLHEQPTVWLDKVCIHQTDEAMKAQQVKALPVFVARSREMLVLWSDTYFERLWCNLELATFAKHGHVEKVRFGPLWLAPWLLSSMLLDLLSTSLLEFLEIAIPNWTAFFMVPLDRAFTETFHLEEGSRQAGFFAALAIWCLSGMCYLPTSIPGCVAFRRKVSNHKLMLEQLSRFDIRNAQCTIESDRPLVEDQVVELWSQESVGRPGPQPSPTPEVESPINREEALQRFNAFVQGPLLGAVVDAIGHEAHVPYHLCVVAFLPMNLYSLVNTLGCDGGPCESSAASAGFQSVGWYLGTQAMAWLLCLLLTFPLTHPVLLRLIRLAMSYSEGYLQTILAVLCCPLAYAYSYVCGGIIWGLMFVTVQDYSPEWLAALVIYVALLVVQACGHQRP